MSIFNRRKDTGDNSIPEDLKPYYEGNGNAWQRWVGPVLRGVLLLVLLGLIVWGGIWAVSKLINRGDDNQGSTASNSTSQQTDGGDDKKSDGNKSGATKPAPAPAPTPSPGPTPAPTSNPPAAKPAPAPAPTPSPQAGQGSGSTQTPTQLANTGPAEVIALFFGIVVIATIGHYFVTAYRVTGR